MTNTDHLSPVTVIRTDGTAVAGVYNSILAIIRTEDGARYTEWTIVDADTVARPA